MNLYLASGNAHKAMEFQALATASGLPLTIHSAREVGGLPPVIEDAGTFVGNATKKARALAGRVPAGAWVLADDSGLCVQALGGAPGVESAYFAGPQADSAANLALLVERMRDVPLAQRGAEFVSVLVLRAPDGREHGFTGRVRGRLLSEPRGRGGFGYDPLFVPEGEERTFSELSEEEKNALSHRGRAWAQLVAWFRQGGAAADTAGE